MKITENGTINIKGCFWQLQLQLIDFRETDWQRRK